MEISKEQLPAIKEQLIEQINSSFPEDKKAEAIQQVESMNEGQLVEFLKQNNLIKTNSSQNSEQQCIFCSIVFGNIPSTKLDENEKSIAILEINPLSEGHAIIIPKEHLDRIPEQAKELAEKIKEKIKATLNPKDILIEQGEMFGHAILNLIPTYSEEIPKQRKKASPEELKEIQKKINSSKIEKIKPEVSEQEIPKEMENLEIPKRIP